MFDDRPITGYVRFSYFGASDTRQKHINRDEAFNQLYNKKRMEARFYLFENICLPSIQAQTDQDFKIVILSSDIMPKKYKDRLLKLIKNIPNIVVDFSEATRIGIALNNHIQEAADHAKFGHHVSFRLDDDDAVSRHYIKKLREISVSLPERSYVTFPKGITVFQDRNNEIMSVQNYRLFGGIGLAQINGPSFKITPFQIQHGAVWQKNITVSDPSLNSFIYTQHPVSDTHRNSYKKAKRAKRLGIKSGTSEGNKLVEDGLAEDFPYLNQEKLHKIIGKIHE